MLSKLAPSEFRVDPSLVNCTNKQQAEADADGERRQKAEADDVQRRLDALKSPHHTIMKLCSQFRDRSPKQMLRLAAFMATGTDTADIDWSKDAHVTNAPFEQATDAYCDINLMAGLVIPKCHVQRKSRKQDDGEDMMADVDDTEGDDNDKLSHKYIHIKEALVKLRRHLDRFGFPDQNDTGGTHMCAMRMTPIPEKELREFKDAGRLSAEYIIQWDEDVKKETEFFVLEFKVTLHDVPLKNAIQFASAHRRNAGFAVFGVVGPQVEIWRKSSLLPTRMTCASPFAPSSRKTSSDSATKTHSRSTA